MDEFNLNTVLLLVVMWSQWTLGKAVDRVFNRIADLEDRLTGVDDD